MSQPKSQAALMVGKRVRSLRVGLAISQETLAELAGVHWTFIGQVERGQRNLTLHNLIRLAVALGTDPASLVGGLGLADLPQTAPKETKAEAIRRARAESAG